MLDANPTIVIASRTALLRDLLRDEAHRRGLTVVSEAADPISAAAAVNNHRPRAVVVEAPEVDEWSTLLSTVRRRKCSVVFITDDASPDTAVALLAGGVDGLLRSDASTSDVMSSVLSLLDGGAALHGDVAALILNQWRVLRGSKNAGGALPRSALTSREFDVLVAMSEGLSTKAVARRLGVALKTVENHKTRVYQKLGARSNAHAISMAIRLGLLQPGESTAIDLRDDASQYDEAR
jgi:DNA-binding NarL/FixJ family response regulator